MLLRPKVQGDTEQDLIPPGTTSSRLQGGASPLEGGHPAPPAPGRGGSHAISPSQSLGAEIGLS